jgi:HlyD family secretion protein
VVVAVETWPGKAVQAHPERTDAPPDAESLPLLVVARDRDPAPKAAPRWWWMLWRVRFVPLLLLLVMSGGVIGLYFQPPGLRLLFGVLGLQPGGGTSRPIAVPAPRRREPAAPLPAAVVALGKVLPMGEVIVIAPPYGAGDARIAELRVAEGDRVARGTVLAVLDSERQLLAAVESARAGVLSREASLSQVRSSVEASRAEARASLARAEASATNAQREFERVSTLRERGFAAEQSFDARRTAREEAAREVERVRAVLSRYGSGDLDQQTDVRVAASAVAAARADLSRAEAELEKAYVRAPADGTVLTIHLRPGEKPGLNGLMNLANIELMKIEAEVYQDGIGRVSIGDPVEATAPALPRPLKGTVMRIGLEVGRQTIVDAIPAANTDARVVKVTVALDPASSEVAKRFTNLQVTTRIQTRGEP